MRYLADSFTRFIGRLEDPVMIEKFSQRLKGIAGIEMESIVGLTYRQLKEEIPDLFARNEYERAMLIVLRTKKKRLKFAKVKRVDNYSKLKFLFWIQDQYKMINQLEAQYLSLPPDPKMVAAGIDELNELGDTNIIDALAGGDILKWEAVKDLSYEMIFDKQRKSTIEALIDRRATKNAKQKK